jgi:hypothetical protein
MTRHLIDWEEEWERLYDERQRSACEYQVHDWSERSHGFSESRKTNHYEYGRKVVNLLRSRGIVTPAIAVAEVGSGPGTFVIPFAPHVRHITAIEPAEGMIRRIEENAAEERITNYSIIPKIWQDVDISGYSRAFDLVLSSAVIWMFRDIMEQVTRMEKVCRGYCCIAAGLDTVSMQALDLWKEVMGDRPQLQYPQYPHIYNILYQNGRVANVEIFQSSSTSSLEQTEIMYRIMFSKIIEYTAEVEQKVKKNLETYAEDLPEGKRIVRTGHTAVIWWDPMQKQTGFGT